MPSLGYFHPQIVHFVVALLAAGVALRWLSLAGRWTWSGPAATTLLLAGTLAAVAAVRSGTEAHEGAERIPGVRPAVQRHEEWGERTRNVFLAVAALELAALVLVRRRRWLHGASAVVGLAGGAALYAAGAYGGQLVYSYAGGVGTRSGDSADVDRLLRAGLFEKGLALRAAGNRSEAARLFDELVRLSPGDTDVAFVGVQSLIEDRQDGPAALAALARITLDPQDRRTARRDFLAADAWALAGRPDSARAILERLAARFPDNPRVRERLAKLPQ